VHAAFQQSCAPVRFDWGLAGALALTEQAGTAAVVVDVLSFATAVSVATDLGIQVYPFRWLDNRAAEFAEAHGAQLASSRRQGGVSLSPASIRAWTGRPSRGRANAKLVLPSPNGSSICSTLADRGSPVLAGCLRNAGLTAGWLARELAGGRLSTVAVIAAGEHWPDGALRPAVEDLWGAGAVLERLSRAAPELPMSPEAQAAAAAFAAVEPNLLRSLMGCASGRELIEARRQRVSIGGAERSRSRASGSAGFAEDVAIAAELDTASTVPLLDGGCFRPA
jgi:2-phosphosulfolactate phosphatase